MGYNPDKPMEDRITDIGPPHYVFSGGNKRKLWQVAVP
jgi:hypothetical protein